MYKSLIFFNENKIGVRCRPIVLFFVPQASISERFLHTVQIKLPSFIWWMFLQYSFRIFCSTFTQVFKYIYITFFCPIYLSFYAAYRPYSNSRPSKIERRKTHRSLDAITTWFYFRSDRNSSGRYWALPQSCKWTENMVSTCFFQQSLVYDPSFMLWSERQINRLTEIITV